MSFPIARGLASNWRTLGCQRLTSNATGFFLELQPQHGALCSLFSQGGFPNPVLTTAKVLQIYLDFAAALDVPSLKTTMTIAQFCASTKLELSVNLKRQ